MTLWCPAHHLPLGLLDNGKSWCPEGHIAHFVSLEEVILECIGTLGRPSGRGAYSGTIDTIAGDVNAS